MDVGARVRNNAAADRLANQAMDTKTAIVTDEHATDDDATGDEATADEATADEATADEATPPAGASRSTSSPTSDPGSGRLSRPSGAGVRFDDESPVTLVLVRHGETAMTVSRGYSGSGEPGPPLNERGRAQARAAAALVHRVGRDLWGDIEYPSEVLASPMVRTQETAGIIAERLGVPVRTDERVKEAHFGQWQGLTAVQIEERWPGQLEPWHTRADLRPPGGESIVDVGERLRSLYEELLVTERDAPSSSCRTRWRSGPPWGSPWARTLARGASCGWRPRR